MNRGRQTRRSLALRVIVYSAVIALGMACPRVQALDPTLDLTQYVHTTWAAPEGLRGSTRSIVQTPDGYLWIGTEFGLVRFDGVRFVPWSPPTGQYLPSANIFTLLAARDGTLWIGTIDGLASWKNGELAQYAQLAGGPVMSLLEDHEGTIWAGTSGKLCGIRSGQPTCDVIDGNPGSGRYDLYGNRAQTVMSLYEDSDGRLWAGTESSLWRWRPGPPRRYLTQPISTEQGLVRGDRAGELIVIGGYNFVVRQVIDNKAHDYAFPRVPPFKPWRLLRDRSGALWIGTLDQGVLRVYQGKTKRFSLNNGLSGNLVTALFEDREGTIWVGTVNGLDRFREPVVSTLSGNQGVSTPAWSLITARDGSVWIGTLDGLHRWNRGEMTIYRSTPSPPKGLEIDVSLREIIDPGLTDNEMHSLFEDQRGRIWVTTRHGIAWFENGRFTPVRDVPASAANVITTDQHKGVWISDVKIGLLHVVEGRVVESVPWPWSKDEDRRVSAIVPDPVSGGMWLGFFDKGIAYFKDGQIERTLTAKDGLGADRVWDLRIGREGDLWAATQGGLSRIKDNRVVTLTARNGLPCDAVNWIMEDDVASLWLYTACGLVHIDRTELEAWETDPKRIIHSTLFDGSDGVRLHALVTGCTPVVARAPDGKLWFAHYDGVSFIDPHNLRVNKVPPPIHVEKVTADGKIYTAVNGMRLPPRIRTLAIDYTALSMVAPEKVHFRYKLEGQDEDWREVVNDRTVQYSNLPPKHYRFRVVASNNSGLWNEEGASLDFVIPPAWFQTNWFRAVCLAVLLALIWVAYRLRIREVEEREKKFREAVESMPALAFIGSSENERTFVNKGWVEYTGLTVEQASGSGWQAAVHPDDIKGVLDKWRNALTTGQPFDYDTRLRRVDGEYRWFHTRVVPVQDKRGRIVKWCGATTDIEDRKRAEVALRRSEAYLGVAQRLSHIGSFGWQVSTGELYWSEETFRIFDIDSATKPSLEVIFQRIHPDDRFFVQQTIDSASRQEGELDFEHRLLLPNGLVKFLRVVGHPSNEGSGKLKYRGAVLDLTETKRAERALRRSEAYLAEAQRLSHTGSWAWSPTTSETLYWSEEMFRIFGFNPKEGLPTGDRFWRRIHPEDRDRVYRLATEAKLAKMEYEHEHRIVLADETVRHIRAIGHPVFDENGRLVEYVGTTIDVTEHKRAEEQRERLRQLEADLVHTNRVSMMGELTASIAHEVNQPLSGIVSNGSACLRWLAAEMPNIEEAREAARRIVRDGKRAGEVIARVRAMTKRTETSREKLDLNGTIREVLAIVGDEAKKNKVAIRTKFADDTFPVLGDRVQLQQVVLNLVMNGIEAMSGLDEQKRELAITSRNVDSDMVQVTIQDSGIGLDPNTMPKIFDPFYTTKPGGMGMGLSISRSILQAHGGRLWAASNDGPGTSFHFILPRYDEASHAAA